MTIVIVIVAILFVLSSVFIVRPISAYTNVTRRAELVDSADLALRRIARDVARAVPNSVRVKQSGNVWALEMLQMVEGMRYRAYPPTTPPGTGVPLNFNAPITTFNVFTQSVFASVDPICIAGNCRLVIYNTGSDASTPNTPVTDNPSPGANVYSTVAAPPCSGCLPPPGSRNITPVGTTVTIPSTTVGNETAITLSPAMQFGLPSPRQRVQIVDTPVTYICNPNNGVASVTRYWGYTINSIQPTDPTVAPLSAGSNAPVATDISSCSFNYQAGTTARNGLLIMTFYVSKGGETIFLTNEVNVDNTP